MHTAVVAGGRLPECSGFAKQPDFGLDEYLEDLEVERAIDTYLVAYAAKLVADALGTLLGPARRLEAGAGPQKRQDRAGHRALRRCQRRRQIEDGLAQQPVQPSGE